jgi:hypothetical protein
MSRTSTDASQLGGPGIPLRIQHQDIFRREGTYAPFPVAELLPDRRLALAFPSNDGPYQDHGFAYDWNVRVSSDGGETWTVPRPDDLSIPYNWPATALATHGPARLGAACRNAQTRASRSIAPAHAARVTTQLWRNDPQKRRLDLTQHGLP